MVEALLDDGWTLEEAVAEVGGNGRPPLRKLKRPRLADDERIRRVAREMALIQGVRWSEVTPDGRRALRYLAELVIRACDRVDEATRRRASGRAGPW
jgi:hypothetical protein